jgi:hypothetical protein
MKIPIARATIKISRSENTFDIRCGFEESKSKEYY